MNRSLRVSLSLLLIALSLAPSLAVGAVLGWGIFEQERANTLQLQRQVTDQAAGELTSHIQGAEAELYALLQTSELRGADRSAQERVLSQALFYRDTFDELSYVRADGVEESRVSRLGPVPEDELHDHSSDRILIEPLRTNKTFYEGFSVSPVNGETLLTMAVPTLNVRTGQPDGALIARVRMRQILDQATTLPLGRTGSIFVADQSGTIVAHPALGSLSPEARTLQPAEEGVAVGLTGGQVLQTRQPISIGNLTLTVGAELPLAEADQDMRQSLLMAGMLLLLIAAATASLCVLTVNRIVAPISALAAAAKGISGGDITRQVEVTRQDELGALQRDFNQMVADLRAQRAAIDERTGALQSSLDQQQRLLETVAQLSTPLLPVWDGVVVLPIVGHVDAQRGEALTRTLVNGVAERRARVAILDITGLATINDEVLLALTRAAQAVELLGSHAMLAGVSSAVARRIVASAISLGSLESYRDLQSAAEAAIERLEAGARA